jgi:hypothetical protein
MVEQAVRSAAQGHQGAVDRQGQGGREVGMSGGNS